MNTQKLLTIKEYAEKVKLSAPRIYQMVHDQKKPLKHVRQYGRILIPVEEETVS